MTPIRRTILAPTIGLLVALTALPGPSAGAPSPIELADGLPEIPDPTPAYASFWKLARSACTGRAPATDGLPVVPSKGETPAVGIPRGACLDRAPATGGLPLLQSKGEVRMYGNAYAAIVVHSPDVRCERAIAFAAPDPESRSGEYAIEVTCETSDADAAAGADAPKCQPKVQAGAWGYYPGHVKIKGRCGVFGPSAQCEFYLPYQSGPNSCVQTGSAGGGNNINCKLTLKKAQYFGMTGWGCFDLI